VLIRYAAALSSALIAGFLVLASHFDDLADVQTVAIAGGVALIATALWGIGASRGRMAPALTFSTLSLTATWNVCAASFWEDLGTVADPTFAGNLAALGVAVFALIAHELALVGGHGRPRRPASVSEPSAN
jgi:hypothetical protein